MYSLDLNVFSKPKLNEIQKHEFVYLRLPSDPTMVDPRSLKVICKSLSEKSDRLFLSMARVEDIQDINEIENESSICWFGIPVDVGNKYSTPYSEHTIYSNIDQLSFDQFENHKMHFQNYLKIIPEFNLVGNHYKLGPTIAEFFNRYKLPFAFLRIDGPPDNQKIHQFKEAFESLRIKGFKGKIYFSFNNPHLEEWNLKTYNTFSGLHTVHIDLSNKCTHSCVFCGVWGPDFIENLKSQNKNKALTQDNIDFMNQQMPYQKVNEILESLPYTLKNVQFGGAGDPLTHPQWLDILSNWRMRGLNIEVLTNFEYPTLDEINILHELAKGRKEFSFYVNVSAATSQVYKTIRPRQSKEVFEKVINNIRYARDLKIRDGQGIQFTMVHIINVYNFNEAVKMVELAHELKSSIYLKPLEIHSDIHKKFKIPKEEYSSFQNIMKQALHRAKELNINIVQKELIEAIIKTSQ